MPSEPMTLADCPVRTTLDVITGKWKPLILFFLKSGTQRYTALRAHLPTASEKVFVQQLRQLEQDQIVIRTVLPGIPPKCGVSH
jgi:DNA-binding HxlR family transcriptional regulator